ncbi:hypothetical protein RB195_003387 [Necator americanus]|uniref:RRM domain-containing protein n=1 Tax=Necator americanus TaxID=51031 RepID=A0ABR1DNC2_NECAM
MLAVIDPGTWKVNESKNPYYMQEQYRYEHEKKHSKISLSAPLLDEPTLITDIPKKKKKSSATSASRIAEDVVLDPPKKKKRGHNDIESDLVVEGAAKKEKNKSGSNAASHGHTAQHLEDMFLDPPKKKKRGTNEIENDFVVEGAAKKKKKKSGSDATSNVTIKKQLEGNYVVGSLSAIFGGGSASTSSENSQEVPIFEGETVIKPKKKQKKELLENKTNGHEESQREGEEEKNKDRVQQRENRKKSHEQRMTLEEKKRTLFVGNAPLSMDERSCKKLFSQFGPVDSVRMRSVIPTKETITKRIAHISHNFHEKQTSVNFYVKFKDEESVQKALAYNGTILDRHRIRVDTCTSKAEYDRKLTVFVGNLPLDANEDELANLFEENVGGVSLVRCVKDQATGMGKGFGFVVFNSASSVPLALSMTGMQFQKRELRITKVMKKTKVAKVQHARRKSGNNSQAETRLTKEQTAKIDKYKFSTRKSNVEKRPALKKKAKKAIQRKKQGKQSKSLMQ